MYLKNIQLGNINNPAVAVTFTDVGEISNNMDIAELRIDQFTSFKSDYVCNKLLQFSHVPTIATIRKKSEDKRSKWSSSEQERLALFQDILDKVDSVDALDIELNATDILDKVITAIDQHQKISIVSFHDFNKTPPLDELVDIITQGKKAGGDIVKIAVQINSDEDIEILKLLTKTHKNKNLIVIGMGEKGAKTRIELPLLGSQMTFASSEQYCSASGQLNYQKTKQKIQERLAQQSTHLNTFKRI